MKIKICNRQKLHKIDASVARRLVAAFMEQAAKTCRTKRVWDDVTLVLVDDAGIIPINQDCFKSSESTDVISLTYDPIPGEQGASAEIVVNVQRAIDEGRKRQPGAAHELALYIAHGCDHVHGACDDTPVQRKRMIEREHRWLRTLVHPDSLNQLMSSRHANTSGTGRQRPLRTRP